MGDALSAAAWNHWTQNDCPATTMKSTVMKTANIQFRRDTIWGLLDP